MEMPESPQIHTLVHLHVCIPTNRLQAHPFYAISSLEYSLFTSHINPPSLLLGSDELAAINPVFYLILSVDAHIHLTIGFRQAQDVLKGPKVHI